MTRGGRTLYGHALGVLMLDTVFPRFVGDVGNAMTWPFPVRYHVISGAVPAKVVTSDPDPALLEPFIAGAKRLEADGVHAITTSCGFLAIYQQQLAAAVTVPVLTSALLQVPLASQLIGAGRAVGVLTERPHLTEEHFAGVGWSARELGVRVGALAADAQFPRVYLEGGTEADPAQLRDEVVAGAQQLCATHPDIGALVMECTNFVPFSQDVRRAIGLPVYDLYTQVMQTYEATVGTEFR